MTTPAITFPPSVFAALQPSAFLQAHLSTPSPQGPSRPSGRSLNALRDAHVNTSSLTHSHGSAVVRLGNTAVVAGIRGEILLADSVPVPYEQPTQAPGDEEAEARDDTIPHLGLLVPNVELSTGCAPGFLPGNPPSAIAQALSARVLSLLLSARVVREEGLKIWYQPPPTKDEGTGEEAQQEPVVKAYWTLYIDVLVIALDGGAFDACWAAVVAALGDTVLPKAWWDDEREGVVCDDRVAEGRRLGLRGLPAASSFAVFEARKSGLVGKVEDGTSWILTDPDGFEEEHCAELITVVTDGDKILRVEKNGGSVIGREHMRSLVVLARESWERWRRLLTEAMAS